MTYIVHRREPRRGDVAVLSAGGEPVDREVLDAEGCEELHSAHAVEALPFSREIVKAAVVNLMPDQQYWEMKNAKFTVCRRE